MRSRRSRGAGALIALSASASACVPSTFDHLTGGRRGGPGGESSAEEQNSRVVSDPNLKAPRQVSPLSVTWVDTLRPTFRWALSEGATGAVVELSQTREFTKVEHAFVGSGTSVKASEDLAAGIWFWRLRGRTDGSEGEVTDKAVVWELLVRGPSKTGATNDTPTGRIYDLDGDGRADLAFSATVSPAFFEAGNGGTRVEGPVSLYMTILADPKDGGLFKQTALLPQGELDPDAAISLGLDIDGDGFSDGVVGSRVVAPEGTFGDVRVFFGDRQGYSEKDETDGWVPTPFIDVQPNLVMAGDVNGDGYADVMVTTATEDFVALGGDRGLGASLMFLPFLSNPTFSAAMRAPWRAIGGCDLDGDGLADVAVASSSTRSPILVARGTRDVFASVGEIALAGDLPAPGPAIAITSGDFGGDGKRELAFTTILADGTGAVCLHADGALTRDRCWTTTGAAEEGFGKGLAAADMEGDGQDEVVLVGPSGVTVLRHDASGFVAAHLAGSFQPSVAVIDPGRPRPARWAVATKDGKKLVVYAGTTESQQIGLVDANILSIGRTLY